jgi:hypothetical protein
VNGPCQDEESTDDKTINGDIAMNNSSLHRLNYVAGVACVQKVTVINDVSIRRAMPPTYRPQSICNEGGEEEHGQLDEWGEGSMQEHVDVNNDNGDLRTRQGCERRASKDTKILA